jgi:hypothetical protein
MGDEKPIRHYYTSVLIGFTKDVVLYWLLIDFKKDALLFGKPSFFFLVPFFFSPGVIVQ